MSGQADARDGLVSALVVGVTTLALGWAALMGFGQAGRGDGAADGIAFGLVLQDQAAGSGPGSRTVTVLLAVRNDGPVAFEGAIRVPGAGRATIRRTVAVTPGTTSELRLSTVVRCGRPASAVLTGRDGLERRVDVAAACSSAGRPGAGAGGGR